MAKDGHLAAVFQTDRTPQMVGVQMGEENEVDIVRRKTDAFQAGEHIGRGPTTINLSILLAQGITETGIEQNVFAVGADDVEVVVHRNQILIVRCNQPLPHHFGNHPEYRPAIQMKPVFNKMENLEAADLYHYLPPR